MRLNSCAKEQSQQNSPHFPTLLNPFAASLDEPEMKIYTTISKREKPIKQFHTKQIISTFLFLVEVMRALNKLCLPWAFFDILLIRSVVWNIPIRLPQCKLKTLKSAEIVSVGQNLKPLTTSPLVVDHTTEGGRLKFQWNKSRISLIFWMESTWG